MKELWCWRCRREMPMLDEEEYAHVLTELLLGSDLLRQGSSSAEAFRSALDLYEEITGLRETNPNALYHHQDRHVRPALQGLRQATQNARCQGLCSLLDEGRESR